MKDGAEAFVLFLCGTQLVLWSSVLTVLDLSEVNATLEIAEIFGLVLSGEGGSADGGWRCGKIFVYTWHDPRWKNGDCLRKLDRQTSGRPQSGLP